MAIVAVIRRLLRVVTPPGNRAGLDSSYRQPNADPTHVSPANASQQQQAGGSGGL